MMITIGVEVKSTQKLQMSQTVRKIMKIDSHICCAFAGLSADARVLVNKARLEAQSYRLSVEDPASLEYIARHVATIQQKFTQQGGRRPFGISTLIGGFDIDGKVSLWETEPSGGYSQWKANAIGRNDKSTREYLEKQFDERKREGLEEELTEAEGIKMAVKALLENVESGSKNIEVAVLRRDKNLEYLSADEIAVLETAIVAEKDQK
jgi:20S proteasome subunit alpha 4